MGRKCDQNNMIEDCEEILLKMGYQSYLNTQGEGVPIDSVKDSEY
jgi:hypothetical protein